MVAIVGVRTFGLARPVLRYAERLVSHDAALRLLAERRALVYDGLVPLVPGGLGRRRGDLLSSIVDDVDSLVDERLRVRQPAWTAVGVGGLAEPADVLDMGNAGTGARLLMGLLAGQGFTSFLTGLFAHLLASLFNHFFTSFTRVRLPTMSLPAFSAPMRRMSRRIEA